MVRLFTDVTQNFVRAIGSQMACLFAVVTNDRMASVRHVTSLVTMSTCVWLSFVAEINQDLAKAKKLWNWLLNTYSEVSNAIFNLFPTFLPKVTTSDVDHITIF